MQIDNNNNIIRSMRRQLHSESKNQSLCVCVCVRELVLGIVIYLVHKSQSPKMIWIIWRRRKKLIKMNAYRLYFASIRLPVMFVLLIKIFNFANESSECVVAFLRWMMRSSICLHWRLFAVFQCDAIVPMQSVEVVTIIFFSLS